MAERGNNNIMGTWVDRWAASKLEQEVVGVVFCIYPLEFYWRERE